MEKKRENRLGWWVSRTPNLPGQDTNNYNLTNLPQLPHSSILDSLSLSWSYISSIETPSYGRSGTQANYTPYISIPGVDAQIT